MVLGFYVSPTANVKRRRDLGLKSHPKDFCLSRLVCTLHIGVTIVAKRYLKFIYFSCCFLMSGAILIAMTSSPDRFGFQNFSISEHVLVTSSRAVVLSSILNEYRHSVLDRFGHGSVEGQFGMFLTCIWY